MSVTVAVLQGLSGIFIGLQSVWLWLLLGGFVATLAMKLMLVLAVRKQRAFVAEVERLVDEKRAEPTAGGREWTKVACEVIIAADAHAYRTKRKEGKKKKLSGLDARLQKFVATPGKPVASRAFLGAEWRQRKCGLFSLRTTTLWLGMAPPLLVVLGVFAMFAHVSTSLAGFAAEAPSMEVAEIALRKFSLSAAQALGYAILGFLFGLGVLFWNAVSAPEASFAELAERFGSAMEGWENVPVATLPRERPRPAVPVVEEDLEELNESTNAHEKISAEPAAPARVAPEFIVPAAAPIAVTRDEGMSWDGPTVQDVVTEETKPGVVEDLETPVEPVLAQIDPPTESGPSDLAEAIDSTPAGEISNGLPFNGPLTSPSEEPVMPHPEPPKFVHMPPPPPEVFPRAKSMSVPAMKVEEEVEEVTKTSWDSRVASAPPPTRSLPAVAPFTASPVESTPEDVPSVEQEVAAMWNNRGETVSEVIPVPMPDMNDEEEMTGSFIDHTISDPDYDEKPAGAEEVDMSALTPPADPLAPTTEPSKPLVPIETLQAQLEQLDQDMWKASDEKHAGTLSEGEWEAKRQTWQTERQELLTQIEYTRNARKQIRAA